MVHYYSRAFRLLNQHLHIYGISLLLMAGNIASSRLAEMKNSFPVWHFLQLGFSLALLSYYFIPTLLYHDALQNKHSTPNKIFRLMVKNFLRTLKPTLIVIVFFVGLLGIIYFLGRPLFNVTHLAFVIFLFVLVSPLVGYFGIFYMLERKSMIVSFRESIRFAVRHLLFTYVPLPFFLVTTLLTTYKIIDFNNNFLAEFLYLGISNYLSLIVTGAYLIYYRKHTHLA